MKKSLKIILMIFIVLISIILLDTLQAIILKNSPIISWKEKLADADSWVDKGILIDTYYCVKEQDIVTVSWKFKVSKFTCPIDDVISEFDFYISKPELYNSVKFNDYYSTNDRTIYLAGNIDEFYIVNENQENTLKNYVSLTYQTFDDSIKTITDALTKTNSLKDGGTNIYKSKEKDIAIVVCKTLGGNKDVYIGDYTMKYEQFMCN